MTTINGKALAQETANKLKTEVNKLKANGVIPSLVIVGIDPDERSQIYIRMKLKRAEEVGIKARLMDLKGKTQSECKYAIKRLNEDNAVTGIITQLPLAGWYDPQDLIDCIDPQKDVDGLTSTNQTALEENRPGLKPATPLAVMEILSANKVDLSGKIVTVVGRSHLVGIPLKFMLQHAGAKVLVGHRQVKDLSQLTKQSDIVISAAGSPGLIKAGMVKEGVIVIDVGINDVNSKLQGDVDFENVSEKASLITSVPGGVGPMTVVMLLQNVVEAAKNLGK